MTDKLLNCPFCGGDDLQIYKPDCNPAREAWIACLSCSQLSGSVEGAIKAWNTRTQIPYNAALEKVARAIDLYLVEHFEVPNAREQAKAALAAMGIEEGK